MLTAHYSVIDFQIDSTLGSTGFPRKVSFCIFDVVYFNGKIFVVFVLVEPVVADAFCLC